MKKKLVLLLVALMTMNMVGCTSGSENQESNPSTQQEAVVNQEVEDVYNELIKVNTEGEIGEEDALRQFSMEMLSEIEDNENPFISPMSVYFVLSMAGSGAEGETKAQIDQVLGQQHAIASKILLEQLNNNNTENYNLSLANAVWIDDQMRVNDSYIKLLTEGYRSEIYNENIAGEEAMNRINSWCDEKTHGMIPKILDQPLDEDASMALLNSIYLDAKWVYEFEHENTYNRDFELENGDSVKVKMMSATGRRDYISTAYGDAVVLPYEDCDLSFVAVLPKEGMSVRDCYNQLAKDDLQKLLQSKNKVDMQLKLPKFEVKSETQLIPIMQKMGVVDAFDQNLANFDGIGCTDDGSGIYASKFYQRAAIKVDEEGTQASAVTIMEMDKATCAMDETEYVYMTFDRPFTYMIVHEPTGTPLFLGIMDNPTK